MVANLIKISALLLLVSCTYIEQSGDGNNVTLDRDSGLLIGSGDTEDDDEEKGEPVLTSPP